MSGRKTQGIMAGMAVFLYIMLIAASSYAAEVVIGSNSADIGTIVFVSPKTGDTAEANGTALRNTLAGITGDIDNRYLIKLGPGTYNLVAPGLQMKQYVSIEGSGEKETKITAAVSAGTISVATVMGAGNAELRSLTVQNTGIGAYTVGILNNSASASPSLINVTATGSGGTTCSFGVYNNSASPVMTNVTATGSGGGLNNYGVFNNSSASPAMTYVTATASGGTSNYGVFNNSSSPSMTYVTATASGGTAQNYGVYNNMSSLTMTNVTATGSGGTYSFGVYNDKTGLVTMTNVTATGSGSGSYGVYNFYFGTVKISHSVLKGVITVYNGTEFITSIGNSQLDGGAVHNDGALLALTCAGVCDENYAFYESTCP